MYKIRRMKSLSILLIVVLSSIFINTNKVDAVPLNSIVLDTPISGSVVKADVLISGSTFNTSGVKDIEIYINGLLHGTIESQETSLDSDAQIEYDDNLTREFSYLVSTDNLESGHNSIVLKSIGFDDTVVSSEVLEIYKELIMHTDELLDNETYKTAEKEPIILENDISSVQLPPLTYIDSPIEKQIINGSSIHVGGWALNASGIKEANIYVDDKLIGKAEIGNLRSDVNRYYPGYPGGENSGYSYNIDTKTIPAGLHEIKVEAIGNDGSISESYRTVTLQKKPPRSSIDIPSNGTTVAGDGVTIGGWALNASGINQVQIYVNGKLIGSASTGGTRTDVNSAYPGYVDGNTSGFAYNLKTEFLVDGKNIVDLKFLGNDSSYENKTIELNRLESRSYIDVPSDRQIIKNKEFTVSGWALNATGIQEVKVYVDGQFIDNAVIGLKREDVNRAYPGYPNGQNSGFHFNVQTKAIPAGTHEILIESVGKDGTVTRSFRKVHIEKAAPISYIDSPLHGSETMERETVIRGWALNASGVKEIQVYVNGTLEGTTFTGSNRADVDAAYPGYPDGAVSGFQYSLSTSSLIVGSNTIQLKIVGNDGSTDHKQIKILRKIALTYIDSPSHNANVKGNSIYVGGWALNATGIKEVNIFVDGKRFGQAEIGNRRSDVNQSYPGYPDGDNSGFGYQIDTKTIPVGTHEIMVEAIGNDGSVSRDYRIITLDKAPSRNSIDIPSNGTTVLGDGVTIGGWALNASGIKEIQIYVNGKIAGTTSIGEERTDVDSVYPGYVDGAVSGYSFTLLRALLSGGFNNILLNYIGYDGSVDSNALTLYMPELIAQNTIYSTNLTTTLNKQMSTNPQSDIYSGKWESAKIQDVEYHLNPSNFISAPEYQTNSSRGKIQISISSLNIRSGPGTNYSIVSAAKNGEIYDILEVSNGWFKISYSDSKIGWVSNTYVAVITENFALKDYTTDMLQFLKLSGTINILPSDLDSELKGKGVLDSTGAYFIQAGIQNNINPVYLMMHAILETGHGRSELANGILVNEINGEPVEPRVVYNVFGIGAVDSNPLKLGAEYAYQQGWFTVEAAILGGGKWISDRYINNSYYKQDTLYKMRWNPLNPGEHQYASDIGWALKQSKLLTNVVDILIKYKVPLLFDFPKYN